MGGIPRMAEPKTEEDKTIYEDLIQWCEDNKWLLRMIEMYKNEEKMTISWKSISDQIKAFA